MAEVRFAPRMVAALERCLADASEFGCAAGQVRLNLSVLARRLTLAEDAESITELFPEAARLEGVSGRYIVPSEYVDVYLEDRRVVNGDFVVHWIELRRWD